MTQDLRARVKTGGVEYYLGKFKTPAEARERELWWKAEHGLPTTRSEINRVAAATRRAWTG